MASTGAADPASANEAVWKSTLGNFAQALHCQDVAMMPTGPACRCLKSLAGRTHVYGVPMGARLKGKLASLEDFISMQNEAWQSKHCSWRQFECVPAGASCTKAGDREPSK